ncbi:MAG: hypothetical protein KBT18_00885 [Comamonas sp.]|nr:hypothetical protein [Candidatus Comamonas equi]
MSDAIDTDMVEDALIVMDQACAAFKKNVFLRATKEMDWAARHKADDVLVCFDAVRYAGHRRSKDLLLVELEQLCEQLDKSMAWSRINRPFDVAAYEQVTTKAQLVQDAVNSALGIHRPCLQLFPRMGLNT